MDKVTRLKGIYTKKDFIISTKEVGSGAKKKVFLTTDKKYAIGIYKNELDLKSLDRIKDNLENYRPNIFNKAGNNYWNKLFAWPFDLVKTEKGKYGVVMPVIPKHLKFSSGNLKSVEKKPNWFIYKNALKMVPANEKGDWKKSLETLLHLARALRRIHSSGLSHSDLSFNNILVDPISGYIYILDLDSLVVPGKYPPEVVGTPGFIAPEVMKSFANKGNSRRTFLPCRETDLYALAVFIYMYLFRRHPLEGKKVWDKDPAIDEVLQKGKNAIFIEDSKKNINRIKDKNAYYPWTDTDALPYTVSGPFLSSLFKKAFEDGLHNPKARPLASEWESALIKTLDLIVDCHNDKCEQKWFVFNKEGKCPFCNTKLKGSFPVVNVLKMDNKKNEYIFDNKQIIPFHGKRIYSWHCNSHVHFNEKLSSEDLQTKAYFYLHKNNWYVINKNLQGVKVINGKKSSNGNLDYYKINKNLKLIMGTRKESRCFEFKLYNF